MFEEFITVILHKISFGIGVIGVIIILLGLLDAIIIYIRDRRNFQKIRYVIGKHILLGLDFLVVKDIFETVFLKGSDVKFMDIVLLVVIVSIRVILTTHTSKGIQEMHNELLRQKKHSKKIDDEFNDLKKEEEELEKHFLELKESDVEFLEKRKELEKKIARLSKLIKQNRKKKPTPFCGKSLSAKAQSGSGSCSSFELKFDGSIHGPPMSDKILRNSPASVGKGHSDKSETERSIFIERYFYIPVNREKSYGSHKMAGKSVINFLCTSLVMHGRGFPNK